MSTTAVAAPAPTPEPAAEAIRARLVAIQRREAWSDRQMAATLGITRSRWQQVRSGETVSDRVAIRAARRWPELRRLVLG